MNPQIQQRPDIIEALRAEGRNFRLQEQGACGILDFADHKMIWIITETNSNTNPHSSCQFAAASQAVRLPASTNKRDPKPVSSTRDSRPTFRGRDKQRLRVTHSEGGVLAAPAWMLNSSLITGLDVKHKFSVGLSNSPLMWSIV